MESRRLLLVRAQQQMVSVALNAKGFAVEEAERAQSISSASSPECRPCSPASNGYDPVQKLEIVLPCKSRKPCLE
ncbi:hypothetical protein AGIG_G10581 [Arapaima gigas]